MNGKIFHEHEIECCTLLEYIQQHPDEEEMRELFLNMDIALKYIHDHHYCIEVFHPSKIKVLNNMPDHIQFDELMELPYDNSTQKDMIREDIFHSAFIQIGIYTNTLKSLTPSFLKENFDDIARFLPEGDVPYYRGVVQRGASVYFSEYAVEKMKRDYEALEQQVADSNSSNNTIAFHPEISSLSNDKINDSIYRKINGLKDSAFVYHILLPFLLIISFLFVGFLGWLAGINH